VPNFATTGRNLTRFSLEGMSEITTMSYLPDVYNRESIFHPGDLMIFPAFFPDLQRPSNFSDAALFRFPGITQIVMCDPITDRSNKNLVAVTVRCAGGGRFILKISRLLF
jgi:hypothetical protein